MTEYIIGVKKEERSSVTNEWMDKVSAHRGVSVKSTDLSRMLVKSSPEIVEKLKIKYSYLLIEEVIPHYTSEETPS